MNSRLRYSPFTTYLLVTSYIGLTSGAITECNKQRYNTTAVDITARSIQHAIAAPFVAPYYIYKTIEKVVTDTLKGNFGQWKN